MRLIDADALMEKYDKTTVWDSWVEINCAPTIDAVPVIRCKDCKKWEADGTYEFDIVGGKSMWGSCSNSLHHCKDNHFCSYGERRADDD